MDDNEKEKERKKKRERRGVLARTFSKLIASQSNLAAAFSLRKNSSGVMNVTPTLNANFLVYALEEERKGRRREREEKGRKV